MPAAIAIPAIIGAASAGTQLIGAKMGANASHDAAKTQSQAADKALAFQQQQYQQARQDFAPYQQQGANAVGQLGQMAARPRMGFDPNQPQGLPQMPMGQLGMAQSGGMNQGPMNAAIPSGGGMVTLRAPDGSTRQFPEAMAAQLIAKGATRVG